jgi:hypothetical protein
VHDDDQLLLGLRFSLNASRPFKPAPAQHYRWQAASRQQQHPALLLRVRRMRTVCTTSNTAAHIYISLLSILRLLSGVIYLNPYESLTVTSAGSNLLLPVALLHALGHAHPISFPAVGLSAGQCVSARGSCQAAGRLRLC